MKAVPSVKGIPAVGKYPGALSRCDSAVFVMSGWNFNMLEREHLPTISNSNNGSRILQIKPSDLKRGTT
jgi:hypothetical protein